MSYATINASDLRLHRCMREGAAQGTGPWLKGELMSNNRDWNKQEWDERNRQAIKQFRASEGKVGTGKTPHLLLTTTGAQSGLTRVNPLHYSTDGDRLIVIASKGGSATHPDWYSNLVA